MTSDNFIVRIYRRDRPDHLVGQVENVDLGYKQSFQSMENLWRILARERTSQESGLNGDQSFGGKE